MLEDILRRAEEFARAGASGEAIVLLKNFRRRPDDWRRADLSGKLAYYRLSVCLKNFAEAAEIGEAVLDDTREFCHVQRLLSPVLSGSPPPFPADYFDEAFSLLARFTADRPDSPWGYFFRTFCLKSTPKGAAVVDGDCRRLRTFDAARYGFMRYETGLRALYGRDFPSADADFAVAAASTEPGHWIAQCLRAEAVLCRGDVDGALRIVSEAERTAQKNSIGDAIAWKGELLLWVGRFADAAAELDRAIALEKTRYAEGWRGCALAAQSRWAEGRAALDRWLEGAPWDDEAAVWRAEAMYRMKDYAAAIGACGRLLEPEKGRKNFYASAIRGLACAAAGDASGLRAAFAEIPKEMLARAARDLGKTDAGFAEILEQLLVSSRGVRRVNYETSVWLR